MNIYFNAIAQCSTLLDTIEDLEDEGVIKQGLKNSARNFSKKMETFINQMFKSVNPKDMKEAQIAFSITHQLLGKVVDMSITEQYELLEKLNNGKGN